MITDQNQYEGFLLDIAMQWNQAVGKTYINSDHLNPRIANLKYPWMAGAGVNLTTPTNQLF